MAQYGYSIKDMNENRARACMRDIPVSYKTAAMIAQRIRGMPASKALIILRGVQDTRIAIPYTKFNDSVGHRPDGLGPGRYPQKAAKLFETLVKNAVANAEDRNLGTDVTIEFVSAQRASQPWHQGTQRHKFKRSHVELIVTNAPITKASLKKAKIVKPAPTKVAAEKNTVPKSSTAKPAKGEAKK